MEVETRVDVALRDLAMLRLAEFRPELGRALVGDAIDDLLRRLDRRDVVRPLTADERTALVESLAATLWRPARRWSPSSTMSRPWFSDAVPQARRAGSTP